MDNKNIKNEIVEDIIEIESNWYSVFKELLIFSGVTFILYCNYYFTTVLSSMIYFHNSAKNKIQEELESQLAAIERYNLSHKYRSASELILPTETQILQHDVKYNEYTLMTYILITPLVFGLIYLLFTQLNLRSRIRVPSTILSFIIVVVIFFNKEFDTLLQEGESILFIINNIVPFIISFFLCLFVLLTPKNGKFSYYN
ncbi:MAG: hypothetical protein WCK82_01585 [Bacteroidota bacterium]